jgi:hypothetical protein
MKHFVIFFIYSIFLTPFKAQAQLDCNHLGAWLWYLEVTDFTTHAELADSLAATGVRRVYVKVADGSPSTTWPELTDTDLVATYKSRGLEVWAWSYNYVNNPTGQASAIYEAAQTGYQGYVVDVEAEFDGLTTELGALFSAFDAKKTQAMTDLSLDSFPLYCTTWGNPLDHNFHIEEINPYVDAFMPQTYVENWGTTYMNNLEFWIITGNQEYAQLGCTKPIHHIVSAEQGLITAAQIDMFIAVSGGESSIWRIPGGGVDPSIWDTWKAVNWDPEFVCPEESATGDLTKFSLTVAPNPATDRVSIQLSTQPTADISVFSADGRVMPLVWEGENILVADWPQGVYFIRSAEGGIGSFVKL